MYNGWRWVGQLDVREACYELSIRGLKTWLAGRLTQLRGKQFLLRCTYWRMVFWKPVFRSRKQRQKPATVRP